MGWQILSLPIMPKSFKKVCLTAFAESEFGNPFTFAESEFGNPVIIAESEFGNPLETREVA
ncbi:MAG: hypothetical protein BWX76_00347 [Candidatus Cloacimonetes bacterium ADurb.Bin089]|nr:MAG: hypothetical protein BWX76_00347 [Candidatus Cloacimonetes bacterium ADurb.Bin089]